MSWHGWVGSIERWLRPLAGVSGETFWLPEQGSTAAADVDWNFFFVYWVSVFFFVLVTFVMFYFLIRYRHRAGHREERTATHNTPLELMWSIIPTGIVVVMFWFGYRTYLDMATPPQNAYQVLVDGQKWNWLFTYPNGHVDGELHVPVGTPVELVMTSKDVIHSFYVPEFRVKRDVIPGRYSKIWFEPTITGEYVILCAEYCGTSHSQMLAKLYVQERGEFDAWLEDAANFLKRMSPVEAGELLYNRRGCKQCHSIDGAAGTGPSFRNLYGRVEAMVGGLQVAADENYIRESILNPQAKIVAGYEPVMPTYQGRLKDEEITAIIEYIKTLTP